MVSHYGRKPIAFFWEGTAINQPHLRVPAPKGKGKIGINPNHPVERVSWWSVLEYANRKSKLEGLDPVYDLSKIKFKGRAEDGTLNATGNTGSNLSINRNANGYRLPTEAEGEFLVRQSGREMEGGTGSTYAFGENQADLGRFTWFRENSGVQRRGETNRQTHPVATKEPIGGLFDTHGNVWEWTESWYNESRRPTGTNPKGPSSGAFRVIRGGSWFDVPGFLRSGVRDGGHPGNGNNSYGFRLVRTASQ